MPEAFVAGLDQKTRNQMIDLMNARLADTIALTLAVKQAHRNLKGAGHIGVHDLLDDVADRLRDGADLMAERAVMLGGHAKGTFEVAAENTEVKAYPMDLEPIADHVAELKSRFLAVGAALHEAIETASEAGDAGTEDQFTDVSRMLDKDCWFIGADAPA